MTCNKAISDLAGRAAECDEIIERGHESGAMLDELLDRLEWLREIVRNYVNEAIEANAVKAEPWFAPIVGYALRGVPVLWAVPDGIFYDRAFIIFHDPGRQWATAEVYEHQFNDGKFPVEWSGGHYFDYGQASGGPEETAKRRAFADLAKRAAHL